MNEFDIIKNLRANISSSPSVLIGPGDDAAYCLWGDKGYLFASDLLVDQVHFDLKKHSWSQIVLKAFAVNCSDIYAMGGRPVHACVSLALGREYLNPDWPPEIAKGYQLAERFYNISIVGGDTNYISGPSVISIAITGKLLGSHPITRSGAKPNDHLYITGPIGGSLKKNRHMDPPNKLKTLESILTETEVTSMIDISDGFSSEIYHLASSSNVGFEIEKGRIPLHPDAASFDSAICDGEDFELLFTASKDFDEVLSSKEKGDLEGITRIGKVSEHSLDITLKEKSKKSILQRGGFEHKKADKLA